ncbi:MAG TPA: RiPP maturation radical SAM C-methyltransferase [Thermoanaerobaculia bacterium]
MSASAPKDACDVLLLAMPFGPLLQPSLGLSLLKAGLEGPGARIEYLTLPFADLAGADFYQWVANEVPSQWVLGDWLFSGALYGEDGHDNGYLEEVIRRDDPGISEERIAEIVRARQLAGPFIEDCLERVRRAAPRIAGFTNAFVQQTASLALARRIKEEMPDVFILFGGANCEGVMGREILRQFPFVDAAVSGEGDRIFPRLVDRILAGGPVDDLPGVHTRESGERTENAPTVMDMDALPIPDFDDFFAQWEASETGRRKEPKVLFESSRGCWWGAARHCTFCGLNGSTMTYRSKSPERALAELERLGERYPGRFILVVDNILDHRYFDSLIPALARAPRRLDLFYALKANLRKDQLRALRDAGITRIQPGIESLSDGVLRRMRKGETALQNVQILKWAKELGLQTAWNLIWGFPGEAPEEYGEMARLLPLLTHLTPPQTAKPIRLDRYSPNFELGPELGFEEIRPCAAYGYVYPLPVEALQSLAYHFDFRYADDRDVETYTAPVAREVERWRAVHPESALMMEARGEELRIWDLRPAAAETLTVLTGLERDLYLACDGVRGLRRLSEETGVAKEEIERRLAPLLERGLMVRQGDLLLSLAIAAAST